jgi:hypothetical protein
MDNLNFLKQIITEEHEYYVVAKKNEYLHFGELDRQKDSIALIVILYSESFRRGVKPDEILLNEIENLRNVSDVPNIYINENYAPFQQGFSLYNVYNGFPIKGNIKEFLIKALALQSDSIYDYKELAESK